MFFIYAPGLKIFYYERLNNLKGQGVLIVPNHVSHLDPPLIGVVCRKPMAFLAKAELFTNKLLRMIIDCLGGIPLNREGIDRKALETGLKVLKQNRNLCLFAEGTRGKGNELNPLNTGIAFLAKKSSVPVLPIAINGTQKILPKGAKKLHRASIQVAIGEPFTYKHIQERLGNMASEKEVKFEFMKELKKRMIEIGKEVGFSYDSEILS